MADWTRVRTRGIRPKMVMGPVSPRLNPKNPVPTSAWASVASTPRLMW